MRWATGEATIVRSSASCATPQAGKLPLRYMGTSISCLVWGDKDWARPSEREHDSRLLRTAATAAIENGGHFLPLDQPRALLDQLEAFAARLQRGKRSVGV